MTIIEKAARRLEKRARQLESIALWANNVSDVEYRRIGFKAKRDRQLARSLRAPAIPTKAEWDAQLREEDAEEQPLTREQALNVIRHLKAVGSSATLGELYERVSGATSQPSQSVR